MSDHRPIVLGLQLPAKSVPVPSRADRDTATTTAVLVPVVTVARAPETAAVAVAIAPPHVHEVWSRAGIKSAKEKGLIGGIESVFASEENDTHDDTSDGSLRTFTTALKTAFGRFVSVRKKVYNAPNTHQPVLPKRDKSGIRKLTTRRHENLTARVDTMNRKISAARNGSGRAADPRSISRRDQWRAALKKMRAKHRAKELRRNAAALEGAESQQSVLWSEWKRLEAKEKGGRRTVIDKIRVTAPDGTSTHVTGDAAVAAVAKQFQSASAADPNPPPMPLAPPPFEKIRRAPPRDINERVRFAGAGPYDTLTEPVQPDAASPNVGAR
jgi:hypothetical protein